jgi:ABC-type Zn2+ transport system substrate-binding protein/surface adhesin
VISYDDKDDKKKKKKKKHKHHHKFHHHGGHHKKKKRKKFFKKKHKHKHKHKHMMKKFMLPMLIAYKLKFFTLIPLFVGKTLFHLGLLVLKNVADVILYMLIQATAIKLKILLALKRAMP